MKNECGQEPRFQCPHCPYKTKQKQNVKKHVDRKHFKTFKKVSAKSTSIAGRYECSRCSRTYKYVQNLREHVNYECGKEPRFQCPHCPYKAKRRFNMKKHVGRKHFVDIIVSSKP